MKDKGFWSVTAYGDDNFLIDNELNRYCINDRSGAALNADGSLDIYLQSTKPTDAAKVNNWLPVGKAGFHLCLRIYLPQDSALDGTWPAPTIKKAEPASSSGSSGCNAGLGGLAALGLMALALGKHR